MERKEKDREKSGKEKRRLRTEEKAGNRETAGTLGHGGWIAPC